MHYTLICAVCLIAPDAHSTDSPNLLTYLQSFLSPSRILEDSARLEGWCIDVSVADATLTKCDSMQAPCVPAVDCTEQRSKTLHRLVSMFTTPKAPELLAAPFSAKDVQRAQRAWGQYLGKPIEFKSSIGLRMNLIPPGKFLMGSGPDAVGPVDNEKPVEVTLTKPFYIGQLEVTQEQYAKVTGENNSHFAQLLIWDIRKFPVECVPWDDAINFCQELTKLDRLAGVISEDWEYTLPTEAQWEYACRAGTTTETHFGNKLSSKDANFDGNDPLNGAGVGPYLKRPEKVGSYPANAFGLHDMHGNVAEWCLDIYQKELPGGVDPIVDSVEGTEPEFVIKGGHWYGDGRQCRSARRFSYAPERLGMFYGFRVVLQQKASVAWVQLVGWLLATTTCGLSRHSDCRSRSPLIALLRRGGLHRPSDLLPKCLTSDPAGPTFDDSRRSPDACHPVIGLNRGRTRPT